MAVWNIINFHSLFAGLDLSAEHYHHEKLHWLRNFQSSNGKEIGGVACNCRNITTPNSKLPTDLPIFDLGAGSKHILQIEDNFEDERISAKKLVKSGDVLVSRLRSYLRQIAIVPASISEALVSTEFIVLRPKSRALITYLVPFFLSKQVQTILAWSQDGNEHPRFDENLLLELRIPPAISAISENLNRLIDQFAEGIISANKTFASAEATLVDALGLTELDLAPRLFYEASYAEASAASRIDAEYFNPRMRNLIVALSKEGLTIADVAPLAKRQFKPESGHPFDYIEISNVTMSGVAESNCIPGEEAPSRAQWIVKPGDVITSTVRPIRRLSALVQPDQSGFVCSSGFAVLEPKGIEPELLLTYLRLPLICELFDLHTTASMYPAISTTDLLRMPIRLPGSKERKTITQQVRQSIAARREASRLLDTAERAVEIAIEKNETEAIRFLKEAGV